MTAKSFFSSSVFVIVLIVILVWGAWYTVDQGERGVILRTGAVIGVADPGLNFKIPLIDSVRYLSVQSRKVSYEKIYAYSRDQQPAVLALSINYRMNPAEVTKIYEDYGSEANVVSRLIDPRANQELKTVFGQFNAVTAIQERERLNREVFDAIFKSVQGPLMVESVQIENIDFSDAYERSIEERMLAEVEVQRVKQNWEREKIQAEIVETKAKAEATAIRLKGEAEAAAINARGKALRDNPALVHLVQAEKWDGKLPSTMVPNASLPMLNLK
ncbi:MAG: prohibitin family protein [Gammaproteobacteria bacterium]|nr:MAG: prohibitin family protein [Gammaproteobacteria bacterium]